MYILVDMHWSGRCRQWCEAVLVAHKGCSPEGAIMTAKGCFWWHLERCVLTDLLDVVARRFVHVAV